MTLIGNVYLFATGFGLGLLISAPVGPVNVLCIQHSLARGFFGGMAIGIGALVADLLIATVAALGITAISGFMKAYEIYIQLGGGVILLAFGLRLIFSHPALVEVGAEEGRLFGHLGAAPQSFLLTITNPGAIFGIFAVIGSAGSAVGGIETYAEAMMLLAGVAVGAALWWFGLARLIAGFRKRLTEERLRWINIGAGALLLACGAALLINGIYNAL